MPLTSKPFRINKQADFQQENIILKSGKPAVTIAPRDPLIWSTPDEKSFTYTRRVRGFFRNFAAIQADNYPLPAFVTLTSHTDCTWPFYGGGNTPCAGESVIHAYPSPHAASAKTVAIITLLQRNTEDGNPDQLTLSQAIAAVVPDILANDPTPSDTGYVAQALTHLGRRFHLTAMLLGWAHDPLQYDIWSNGNDETLMARTTEAIGPYLLPLLRYNPPPA